MAESTDKLEVKCSSTNEEDKENEADVYSLQEILDSEKERNEIATAVLGASDEVNCSYDNGYVFRQALYGCKTCLKAAGCNLNDPDVDPSLLHGICLACSYECHQNHELYELYTKREFRCDCGNEKFAKADLVCKLKPQKDKLNAQNKYNHNFVGLYCTCNRPYPESDSTLETTADEDPTPTTSNEEMIQCSICEDWFHSSHLPGSELFKNGEDDYADMICHQCMNNNDFLWNYVGQMALKSEYANEPVNVVDTKESESKNSASNECRLATLRAQCEKFTHEKMLQARKDQKCSCFFLNGWREALCKCETCAQMYKDKQVEYLTRENDTINYYEERGKLKAKDVDENKLLNDELSKMNRFSQVEFLHNYNDFKQDLTEFFCQFARNGQVVKRENVVEFFENLNERKKRKLDSEQNLMGSNYFCK